VGIEHLFSGSALSAVDARGAMSLPPFVRGVIERRTDGRAVTFGVHEADPCLTAYDRGYEHDLHAELERRRLRDAVAGTKADTHHARARRAFGLAEDADFDGAGRIMLPAMLRALGKIEDLALFVGAGRTFEIWNPQIARKAGGPDLRVLAEYRLGEKSALEGRLAR